MIRVRATTVAAVLTGWVAVSPPVHAQMAEAMQQSARCALQYTTDTRAPSALAMIRNACSELAQGARPLNDANRRYDLCLLQHLPGTLSNAAASQIAGACRTAIGLF